jgi:hypothetical protein
MLGGAELASNDGILPHRDELNGDDGAPRGPRVATRKSSPGDGGLDTGHPGLRHWVAYTYNVYLQNVGD